MARRKTTTATASKKEEVLTQDEVYNVLEFARNLYNGGYQNVLTPDLVNSRMKDSTMTPIVATLDKINEALIDPTNSEEELIGYSEWLELNSTLYRRILLYFSGLLSFDWTYTAIGVKDPKEYKSPKFKKDLLVVEEFFDKFKVKEFFPLAMREMLRTETFFGVFRDDGDTFVIQELPRQYCMITGRFDKGLVFDFNMVWFLQAGVDLNMYPKPFKRMYKDTLMEGSGTNNYNPALAIGSRSNTWAYWTQTKPSDGFVAFKLFPEIATNVPFLSPLMPDAVLQPLIRSLQTNSYIADASKLIAGSVPFLKDAKTSVKDAIALDPTTLGKFLSLMKSALPDAVKLISAPLENIESLEFKGNNEMYDSYMKSTASAAGINSRLIYSNDRQNVLETKLSMDVDQNVLRPVYNIFSNMLEYWVNQRTKTYKFKFEFEGFNTSIDREERRDTALKLADSGMVLEQKIAASLGMSVFDFRRQLAETKASGFVNNLTPILKANQMSGDSSTGRPQSKDSDLSDSGADTKTSGSNEEKGEE